MNLNICIHFTPTVHRLPTMRLQRRTARRPVATFTLPSRVITTPQRVTGQFFTPQLLVRAKQSGPTNAPIQPKTP